jgi:hypothetical protein
MPLAASCKACKRPMRVVAIWIPDKVPKPIVGFVCKCGGYAETDQYAKTTYAPKLKLDRGASPIHLAIWMELKMFGKDG